MKLKNLCYFIVNDFVAKIKRDKKFLLLSLFLLVVGIVIGVILGTKSTKEIECIISQIVTDNYNPIKTYFSFTLLPIILAIILYLSPLKKWLEILSNIVWIVLGANMGKNVTLYIKICGFNGILSSIIFLLVFYVITFFLLLYVKTTVCEEGVSACDLRIFSRKKLFSKISKVFTLYLVLSFLIFVVICGLLDLLI